VRDRISQRGLTMTTAGGGGAAYDARVSTQDGDAPLDAAPDLDHLAYVAERAQANLDAAAEKAALAEAEVKAAGKAEKDAAKALKDAQRELDRARKEAGE
jgi:hypothetical protein